MEPLYTLIEDQNYTNQLVQLRIDVLDDGLLAAQWALSSSPESYPTVRGYPEIRLCKITTKDMKVLSTWFILRAEDQDVHLLYIAFV